MPRWIIPVSRVDPFSLPVIDVRINNIEFLFAVSSSEPFTSVTPGLLARLNAASSPGPVTSARSQPVQELVRTTRRRYMHVPLDSGITHVDPVPLPDIQLLTKPDGWQSFGGLVAALTSRGVALSVDGILGVNFLSRFVYIAYRNCGESSGDELILEQ